ncbi:MAG TPA: hypothetical protein VM261_01600 [Kofleriaceae bacterium]|nr:hypothetical protein [Kofleriaceae bacterium]
MTRGWRDIATLALVCGSIVAAGCQDDVTTMFPAGLEPLEDNAAPEPPGGPSSEELMLVSSDGEHKWVHGRGFIQAPTAAVWSASKDPEGMANCDTTSHTPTVGTEPEYEYGFEMHYYVDDVLNVEWDELWRYGTIEGVADAPTFAIIRYQKVFGSDLITTLEGSAIFLATDVADRTEVQFVEHLTALGGSIDNMKHSTQHRFDVLSAVVHGRDIPPCP